MSVWMPHQHVVLRYAGWRARGRLRCVRVTWMICCACSAVVAQVLYGSHEPLAVAQAWYCQIHLQHIRISHSALAIAAHALT